MMRTPRVLPLAALVLLLGVATALAGPFGPGSGPDRSAQSERPAARPGPDDAAAAAADRGAPLLRVPEPVASLLLRAARVQKQIKQGMSDRARIIREQPFGGAFWGFLGLAFVYGMVHALGPGHGKTVVSAYCLGRPGSPARAMLMGMALSMTHVGSATLLVGLAWLLLSGNAGGFADAGIWLERTSYALLLLLGLWLGVGALKNFDKSVQGTSPNPPQSLRGMLATAFVTGLVPCPGATLILAFSLALGIPWTGLFSMTFLALGMGLTTGLFGVAASGAGGAALACSGRNRTRAARLHALLTLAGAVVILLFGGLMLSGSFA